MLLKYCTQYARKFGTHSSGHRTGKGQFSFQSQGKANAKEYSNNCTFALISHTSKVMLKILKAWLKQYTENFQMFNLDLEKAEEPEIKFPTSAGSLKKQESFRKTSTSALVTMPKPLIVWITTNCGKFLKQWEYHAMLPASWEICMQVKKQQLGMDMKQQVLNWERLFKAVYCHPVYSTYMHSTSYKMPHWMKHILESRLQGKISIWAQ